MPKTNVTLPNSSKEPKDGNGKVAPVKVCPFTPAEAKKKRLKLFIYGQSGTGKTFLSLHFPGVAIADLEGGTDHYVERVPTFQVLRCTTFAELYDSVEWLAYNDHQFRTLVIDPATKAWQSLIDHWTQVFLRRDTRSKGHKIDYFDLQPGHWTKIKKDWARLIRLLHVLDMNIVVTAHQKPKYADSQFMQVVGETFDAERSMDYEFDTVIQTTRDANGAFISKCIKDRTGHLPENETFATDYKLFQKVFGKRALERKAKKSAPPIDDDVRLRIGEILAILKTKPSTIAKRLKERFGVVTVAELKADEGVVLLKELEAKLPKEAESCHS